MMQPREQLRTIRNNVMNILADLQELEAKVASDPAVEPIIKKAVRGKGGRFVKKS